MGATNISMLHVNVYTYIHNIYSRQPAIVYNEEDGLSPVGIEVVLVVVVVVVIVVVVAVGGGGGVLPPPSVSALSASVGEVDVSVINWVVGV